MSNNYYSKQYTGNKIITWKNFTDTSTPLSAANLQKSHSAINDVDNEVFAAFQLVDQTKLDKSEVQNAIKNVSFNPDTGTFVFTLFSGSTLTFDTNLEKIVVNFSYNPLTQKLELTQSDGTVVEVDLSAFVANPDLQDSTEIGWTINANGQISAYIKNNSITDSKMQPNYLADITEQAGDAEASAETAEYNAKLSQSYANGTSNLSDRPNEGIDNAKYYSEQAAAVNAAVQTAKTDAVNAANLASESASDAAQSASDADTSANNADISATDAANSALDAEAYAAGTRNGTDVQSSDPCYNNNAKYYSEQAADSVDSIGDSVERAEAWAVGTKDGTPVASTDTTYHNNSKYYAEKCYADSVDAESAAQSAADSAELAASYSQIIFPGVYIDFDTMELMQKDTPQPSNIVLTLDENKILSYDVVTT